MAWTIEQLGKKGDSYFAHPQVGEGVAVTVLGEVAADVVVVANQIEARVCVPDALAKARQAFDDGLAVDDEGPQTDEQFAELKARFAAFKASCLAERYDNFVEWAKARGV